MLYCSPFAETPVIVDDHCVQDCAIFLHMLPQIFGCDIVEQIADVHGFVRRDFDLGSFGCLLLGRLLTLRARG